MMGLADLAVFVKAYLGFGCFLALVASLLVPLSRNEFSPSILLNLLRLILFWPFMTWKIDR